jgi:hypothetical protein
VVVRRRGRQLVRDADRDRPRLEDLHERCRVEPRRDLAGEDGPVEAGEDGAAAQVLAGGADEERLEAHSR